MWEVINDEGETTPKPVTEAAKEAVSQIELEEVIKQLFPDGPFTIADFIVNLNKSAGKTPENEKAALMQTKMITNAIQHLVETGVLGRDGDEYYLKASA